MLPKKSITSYILLVLMIGTAFPVEAAESINERAEREGELLNIRLLKIRPYKEISEEEMKEHKTRFAFERHATKIDPKAMARVRCRSGKTEYLKETIIDCSKGIIKFDTRETGLYAGRGKNHAYIQMMLHLPEKKRTLMKIDQDIVFPSQQEVSVYSRNPDDEQDEWQLVCSGLNEQSAVCEITPALYKEDIELSIESYSREGPLLWKVNSISFYQVDYILESTIRRQARKTRDSQPHEQEIPPENSQQEASNEQEGITEISLLDQQVNFLEFVDTIKEVSVDVLKNVSLSIIKNMSEPAPAEKAGMENIVEEIKEEVACQVCAS